MEDNDQTELMQAAKRTSDVLAGRIPTSARVKTPREEFLQVELVPLSLVARLNELNSDASLTQGLFWALVGGLVGVVTSLVLNGTSVSTIDKATWVTVAALVIGIGICGALWQRTAKRADQAKRNLFDDLHRP